MLSSTIRKAGKRISSSTTNSNLPLLHFTKNAANKKAIAAFHSFARNGLKTCNSKRNMITATSLRSYNTNFEQMIDNEEDIYADEEDVEEMSRFPSSFWFGVAVLTGIYGAYFSYLYYEYLDFFRYELAAPKLTKLSAALSACNFTGVWPDFVLNANFHTMLVKAITSTKIMAALNKKDLEFHDLVLALESFLTAPIARFSQEMWSEGYIDNARAKVEETLQSPKSEKAAKLLYVLAKSPHLIDQVVADERVEKLIADFAKDEKLKPIAARFLQKLYDNRRKFKNETSIAKLNELASKYKLKVKKSHMYYKDVMHAAFWGGCMAATVYYMKFRWHLRIPFGVPQSFLRSRRNIVVATIGTSVLADRVAKSNAVQNKLFFQDEQGRWHCKQNTAATLFILNNSVTFFAFLLAWRYCRYIVAPGLVGAMIYITYLAYRSERVIRRKEKDGNTTTEQQQQHDSEKN